jgi:uncharacterized protein YggU (UPF0235/DUF167 family)
LSDETSELSIDETDSGVAFWIHVTPGARRHRIGGTNGDALRIAVTSRPVGGRANAACVLAIAEALGVPAAAVQIAMSARGRRKRVGVIGSIVALQERLRALARV